MKALARYLTSKRESASCGVSQSRAVSRRTAKALPKRRIRYRKACITAPE